MLLAWSVDGLARNFHACGSLVRDPILLLLVHLLVLRIAALMLDIQVTLIVLRLFYLVVFLVSAVQCFRIGLGFMVRRSVARRMPCMSASLERHRARQVTSWFPLIGNAIVVAAAENLGKAEPARLLAGIIRRRPLLHVGVSTARSAHLLCVVEGLARSGWSARFSIKLSSRGHGRDKNFLVDSVGNSPLGCQQPLVMMHIRWRILIIVVWAVIRILFPRHLAIRVGVVLVIMELPTGWGISLLQLSHHERYLHFLLLMMLIFWLFNVIHCVDCL